MGTINAEMQEVMDRLAKVERQNRWLVRGCLALVLSCGIAMLMAQKPLESVAQTIEAQAFVLKDAAGEVRAKLHMTGDGPELRLYDSQHNTFAVIFLHKDGPGFSLSMGKAYADLSVEKDGPARLSLSTGNAYARLLVYKDGPNLSLEDSEGFNASIGNQGLVTPKTGEKTQSSAASIHLFDPKGKILWSAP